MKKFLLMPVLLLTLLCSAAGPGNLWLTDLAKAERASKQEGKPILMLFTGSDWCPYCVKMEKEVYSSVEFQKFAKRKLVLLMLDFPARKKLPEKTVQQNRALLRKYGVRGYPTCILVSPEGRELTRISGARRRSDFLAELDEAIPAQKK